MSVVKFCIVGMIHLCGEFFFGWSVVSFLQALSCLCKDYSKVMNTANSKQMGKGSSQPAQWQAAWLYVALCITSGRHPCYIASYKCGLSWLTISILTSQRFFSKQSVCTTGMWVLWYGMLGSVVISATKQNCSWWRELPELRCRIVFLSPKSSVTQSFRPFISFLERPCLHFFFFFLSLCRITVRWIVSVCGYVQCVAPQCWLKSSMPWKVCTCFWSTKLMMIDLFCSISVWGGRLI